MWFVDLTQLRDTGLLTQNVQDPDVLAFLVTATLGLRQQGGGSPVQVLAGQLADRRMLLVLDNCEHLLPASAILAYALLRGCPDLRILTTSREPLAIELAAARVRVLAPREILDRLADRFAVLSRGSRAAPGRQQTLRACVDWSFDLCAKPERILWARLSVFAGGFELDAVEGICADEHLPEADMFDVVAALVEKSILFSDVRDRYGEAARYRMLETIRVYGQDQLIKAGKDAVLHRRHRDWCQRLAARANAEWISDRQTYWLARLDGEHPNLRAAVEFCLTEPGEAEDALELAVALPMSYWAARGLFAEGRSWLDHALAQATAPTALRARALLVNSFLASLQGDIAAGMRLLGEGEELAQRLHASVGLAHAAYIRGVGALIINDLPVAVELLDRARMTLSEAPDRDLDLYLTVLTMFGVAAALAGEYELANASVGRCW